MSLATLFQATTSKFDLRKEVALALSRDSEVLPLEKTSWIRASGIAYLCAREEVLAASNGEIRQGFSDPNLLLTFLHGTALHWAVQNHLLPKRGLLYGVWRCLCCGQLTGGLNSAEKAELLRLKESESPDLSRFRVLLERQGETGTSLVLRPSVCHVCGVTEREKGDELLFEYVEQWFGDLEHRVGGHPDGVLVIPGMAGSGILEIKSISSNTVWKVRHVPQMEHLIQAHTYMWLTGRSWCLIVYWAKGTHGLSSLIPHFVERDEGVVCKLKVLVSSIWKGLDEGVLPQRICTSPHCVRAGECPLKGICFSESDASDEEVCSP